MKLIKRLFERKEIRFLFVGGINTAVGYGVYALCLLFGLHYALAQLISTVVGVINSYFWNKYFTFRQRERSASEAVRFIAVYAVGFAVNEGLLALIAGFLGVNEYIAGAACLLVTTLISYFGHNLFSFAKKKG